MRRASPRRRSPRVTPLLAWLALAACTGGEAPIAAGDVGPRVDAAVADDASEAAPDAAVDASTPDAGLPPDTCDPLAQDCPSPAGARCIVEGGPAACVESGTTSLPLDALCRGGECAPGLACVRQADAARCVQLCDPERGAPCAPDVAECLVRLRGTRWGACVPLPPTCAPAASDLCAADLGCQPFRRFDGRFDFRCQPTGAGAVGASCTGVGSCARGLACVRESGVAQCRRLCSVDADCAPEACSGSVAGGRYCR